MTPTTPRGTTVRSATLPSPARLYADTARKAAAAATIGRLHGGSGGGATPTAALPDVALEVGGIRADPERLTGYQHLLGEPGTDALPPGYVHTLVFPLAIAFMNRDDFPLPPAGMVHVANRIEQQRAIELGETLDLRVTAQDLRRHPRGTQVDLVSEVTSSGDEAVWRGVSTYLARGVSLALDDIESARGVSLAPGDADGRTDTHGATDGATDIDAGESAVPERPTAVWRLGGDVGRRFASVSGDVNPIHLSALSAKAFGFRRTLAHGMYTAARALAVAGAPRDGRFTWSVAFGSPVYLPSTVALGVDVTDPVRRASSGVVWSPGSGRVHLRFEVTPTT